MDYTNQSEQGSVLLATIFFLILLTVIGLAATQDSDVELQIAANDRFHKVALTNADSGVHITPKVISAAIEQNGDPALSNATYVGGSGTFFRELMGFDSYDNATDIIFNLGAQQSEVDVERIGVRYLSGGGVEFASGSEGIGVGSSGGVAVYYLMDSTGDGPHSSQSNIDAIYRKVVGTPGGL